MSNFQTILVAIFLAIFVFAVLIFSGVINIGNKSNAPEGKVVVWGTFPNSSVSSVFDTIGGNSKDLDITYSQKDPANFQQDLIEAFANGVGPDLFIITPDMVQKNYNFIYKISYESYPEKTFRETFIDGADIYLDTEGILAFPIVVDPIVLYYNKDILTNEGIVYPPKTWDELFGLNASLTKRENSGTINQSMIALGQYNNLYNAKDILALLMLQNNNPLIEKSNDEFVSTLNSNASNLSISPIDAVLKFFLEFSNQSSSAYSWNRSLPNSLDMFTAGKSAMYIGKASEIFTIESMNPNLSFDVTQIPQIRNSTAKRTFGDIYAVVVSSKSANITSAFGVAGMLSSGDDANNFSMAVSLPPAGRALLSKKPKDPYLFTFFNSALISRSWLDPDAYSSNLIFRELIENILSNQLSMGEAINKAQKQFEVLLRK